MKLYEYIILYHTTSFKMSFSFFGVCLVSQLHGCSTNGTAFFSRSHQAWRPTNEQEREVVLVVVGWLGKPATEGMRVVGVAGANKK